MNGEQSEPEAVCLSIVDDDESVREAIKSLLRSAGFRAEAFASADEFLASSRLPDTRCLILDVRMPGMSGLELQRYLSAAGYHIPMIFISAHADAEERARALQAGAVDFLHKPFSDEALLGGIQSALDHHAQ